MFLNFILYFSTVIYNENNKRIFNTDDKIGYIGNKNTTILAIKLYFIKNHNINSDTLQFMDGDNSTEIYNKLFVHYKDRGYNINSFDELPIYISQNIKLHEYQYNIFKQFSTLKESTDSMDIIILTKDKVVSRAHSLILATRCEYFSKVLQPQFKDINKVINLSNYSKKSIDILLQYLYLYTHDKIDSNNINYNELLELADYLQLFEFTQFVNKIE
jgi:hypothetical protein